VERAQDWRWSSTRVHLRSKDDGVTAIKPARDRIPRFPDLVATEAESDLSACARPRRSGRPLGDERFLTRLERLTRRVLKPGKRGPKPVGKE
jgi:putative transposase